MAEETHRREAERRSAAREPIDRPVVFSGVRGEGLLRQGTAVDISASGLLIHTAKPDLAGRHLDIELHPESALGAGDVIMVRGEVVWVKPLPRGSESAMGVRFMQSVPATDVTGAHYRPADREESERLAQSIRRKLEEMAPAARLELSDAARRMGQSSAPALRPARARRRYRSALLFLFFLFALSGAVVLLTLAVFNRYGYLGETPRRMFTASPVTLPDADSDDMEATATAPPVTDDLIARKLEQIEAEGPAYYVNRGSFWLAQGRYPAAAQAFQAAQRLPDITPIERYIAQLGEAQALAGDNDIPGALAVLESPFEDIDYIPEAWRALKTQFRDALTAEPGAPGARWPMINAFTIEGAAAPKAGDSNALRIEIDTTRYLLNVLENNAIKAVYPVGLGARNLTPDGQFTIVNKIENPDWYNKGDVVPAGDPENQLGSRWLGLGDESGPTPIGIHATEDLDSIGNNESKGCIRMRPEDIEALFNLVPVGTPVHIRAL